MNKSNKFTPGPWLEDGNGFEPTWDVSNKDGSICTVRTNRADARLIAAAPELYECLKTAAAYNKAMPTPVERAVFADTLMKLFEKIERG